MSDKRTGQQKMNDVPIRKGDRVRMKHSGENGTVHAIWDGAEDTIEVKLDSGCFTCCDPPHIEVIAQIRGLS